MPRLSTPLIADLLLLAVAVAWGSTYLVAKNLVAASSVDVVLSARMLLATALMALVLATTGSRPRAHELRTGAITGALLAGVFLLETHGIAHTSATNAGLIISLTVLFTPLLQSAITRRAPSAAFMGAAGMAVVGVGLLAGGEGFRPPGLGDVLVLAAAVVRTLHVTAVQALTRRWPSDPLRVTTVQMATCAVVFTIVGVAVDPDLGADMLRLAAAQWAPLLYLAVGCTVFAFLVQTWAIARSSASRVSLLLGTEPIWAAVIGVTLAHEVLTPQGLIGIVLVLLGTGIGRRLDGRTRERDETARYGHADDMLDSADRRPRRPTAGAGSTRTPLEPGGSTAGTGPSLRG